MKTRVFIALAVGVGVGVVAATYHQRAKEIFLKLADQTAVAIASRTP